MKRWSAAVLLAALILLAITPDSALMAAPAEEKLEEEIEALRRQILDLKKQIIDKLVAAGKLTAEEGEKYKQKLDERLEWQLKHGLEKLPKEGKGKMRKLKPNLRDRQDVPAD